MPILFKETVGQTLVEMSTCDNEVYVTKYKSDNTWLMSKYELTAPGLQHALDTYNNHITELLQRELDKADAEGLYDDGYEFYDEDK